MEKVEKKIEPRRLKGFRDYMPDLMEVRSQWQGSIRQHAQMAGFREIGTPALEYAEILVGQGSDETDKQVYRFEDHGQRAVALRFDLTVPFARFVAEHQGELIFPFKRLQIGDVWRGENTQKGRYREFCQCDLDIIGVDSVHADIEVILCFFRILSDMNLGGFTMRLGNRLLLTSILVKAFPDITKDGESLALIALDKLDKIGPDGVCELLVKIPGTTLGGAKSLLSCLSSRDKAGGTDRAVIRDYLMGHEAGYKELERMELILRMVEVAGKGLSGGRAVLDLSIARGLGYYTGVVFETTLDKLPGFGSVCSGGRYNNLAERFSNRSLPGVGGSIGLDRLLAGVEELGKLNSHRLQLVFIAVATEDALETAVTLLSNLRSQGIACDLGMTPGKVGNQFKHADRLGCPLVVTIGTAEVESNTCNVKVMKTGVEQKGVPLGDLVEKIDAMMV